MRAELILEESSSLMKTTSIADDSRPTCFWWNYSSRIWVHCSKQFVGWQQACHGLSLLFSVQIGLIKFRFGRISFPYVSNARISVDSVLAMMSSLYHTNTSPIVLFHTYRHLQWIALLFIFLSNIENNEFCARHALSPRYKKHTHRIFLSYTLCLSNRL